MNPEYQLTITSYKRQDFPRGQDHPVEIKYPRIKNLKN